MKKIVKPVVFITGASSGIGRGLAERFIRDNYKVVVTARRSELLKELGETNPAVLTIKCDVRDKEAMSRAVLACQDKFGAIDIFIANAGISASSPAHEFKAEVYEELFRTNVLGAIYGFEAVVPEMIMRKSGQLVGISSLAGYRGLPESAAYCASKAALSAIMESLRQDLKKFNIAVNLIKPGFIKSPLTDKNRFHMPFLLDLDKGVDKIYKAIRKNKKIYAFPWPLAFGISLGRLLPPSIFDYFLKGKKNVKV